MKKGLFSDQTFNRKLITLALPLALQSLMLAMVAAADAIMLGRLDQNSMSAVSLATQVQFVMNMFLASIASAGSILAAQYWGKRDTASMDIIFNMMIRGIIMIDILFGTACIFIPHTLMAFFTNDAVLNQIGSGYLHIAGFSYLLVGISQAYQTIMKVTDHASQAAVISTSAVIINIVCNSILIFGLLGFPAMGADGAAAATLISRIGELIWSIGISYAKTYVHPDLKHLFTRDKLLAKDYRKVLLPLLFGSPLWGFGFTCYTAVIGHLGQDAAAANSVAAVIRDLTCCMCNGAGGAAAIMLGNELGQENMDAAKEYGHRLMKLSFMIGLMTTALVLVLIPAALKFYRLTEEAQHLLVQMLVITSVYMIGRCVNTIMINGIFDGGGDTKFDMYSLIVMMWCVAVPTALLGAFVFHWPVAAVYACTCMDEVGKIPWTIAHFYKYKWLNNLTR